MACKCKECNPSFRDTIKGIETLMDEEDGKIWGLPAPHCPSCGNKEWVVMEDLDGNTIGKHRGVPVEGYYCGHCKKSRSEYSGYYRKAMITSALPILCVRSRSFGFRLADPDLGDIRDRRRLEDNKVENGHG